MGRGWCRCEGRRQREGSERDGMVRSRVMEGEIDMKMERETKRRSMKREIKMGMDGE
jgi:hypothetical protein